MNGRLVDLDGRAFARVKLDAVGELHRGQLQWLVDDVEWLTLWSHFEAAVEGQCFVEVDRLEQQIEAMQIRWVTDDGRQLELTDLQIYPSTLSVSFRV